MRKSVTGGTLSQDLPHYYLRQAMADTKGDCKMLFVSTNEAACITDSEIIQNAIRKAKETGCNKVVIPGNNNGRRVWEITDTILLWTK